MQQNNFRGLLNSTAASFVQANHVYREIADRLLEHLAPIKLAPQRILDLGTGCGTLLSGLRRQFPKAEIVAQDIAEQRLQQINNKSLFHKPYQIVCADSLQIPFAADTFDLVIANLVLHWLPNPSAWFTEVQRVLQNDGLFIFSYYGPSTFRELGAATNSLLDMHNVGDALVRAQLTHPVLDSEELSVEYDRVEDAIADLAANGEINLFTANPISQDNFELTYEIVYAHAWKAAQPMTSKVDQDGMVRISPHQISKKA